MKKDIRFISQYGSYALILGGSEGIGYAFAEHLAQQGLHLILVARTQNTLEKVAGDLRQHYSVQVHTIATDLSHIDAASIITQHVIDKDVGLLICNAGASHGATPFMQSPLEELQRTIAINCVMPVTLLHKLLPNMSQRQNVNKKTGVIFVSSMSGVVGGGYTATYSAAKAFMQNLSEGLYYELHDKGIDILCAMVGLTATPALERNVSSIPGLLKPASSEKVAADILHSLGKKNVWYAVGTPLAWLMRILPRTFLTRRMSAVSAQLFE